MARTEENAGLEASSEDQIHYVNLAGGYHLGTPALPLSFSANVPLTSSDIAIKQEYHVPPTRINGETHNGSGAAYPMGESKIYWRQRLMRERSNFLVH